MKLVNISSIIRKLVLQLVPSFERLFKIVTVKAKVSLGRYSSSSFIS